MSTRPGDIIPMHYSSGGCIVVGTSRHKHRWPIAVATNALITKAEDEGRARPLTVQPDRWFSHRKDAECFCEDPDASWCPDGNGTAWIDVLYERETGQPLCVAIPTDEGDEE